MARLRHPLRASLPLGRGLGLGLGLCIASSPAIGCGGRATTEEGESGESGEESAEESATETGTEEGEETGETGEEGPQPTGMCEAFVVDHETDCSIDCPIVLDVKVGCDDTEFGDPGLRVAPRGDEGAWLVTSSSDHAWMMRLDPDASLEEGELPSEFARGTISLALDPAGEPHLAVDATNFDGGDYAGALTYLSLGAGEYLLETVFDRDDKYIPLFDMEIDAGGTAHVWYSSEPPDENSEARRSPSGDWTQQLAPVPGDSGWQRYTVLGDGTPVAFDFDDPAGSWYLWALQGGDTRQIGTGWGSSYPGAYVMITPPTLPSLDVAGPDFVVVKEHVNNVRVAWPTDSEFGEVFVPESEPLELNCLEGVDGSPGSCPETCEETAEGLIEGSTAIARTRDGRVWVGWVVTHYDQSRDVTESCDEEVGCWCNSFVTREDSWSEIILAEVDTQAGTLVERMRLGERDPYVQGRFLDYRESPRIFDMRAFDTDLAVGMRVRGDEDDRPHMRVIRIDTTGIGG